MPELPYALLGMDATSGTFPPLSAEEIREGGSEGGRGMSCVRHVIKCIAMANSSWSNRPSCCVCVCVCVFVCVCVCVCVYIYIYIYIYIYNIKDGALRWRTQAGQTGRPVVCVCACACVCGYVCVYIVCIHGVLR